ncbi:MAG: Obg family GTPase CgtA, partial [Candidatus Saccharibacteria bacterium]|nr:Obg family GTPase CgtA [Candidatus Saccharibacteria bacterium]
VNEVRAVQALESPEEDDETTVITLGEDQLSNHWEVIFDQESQVYQVSGEKIEKFARRTNYDNYETLNRLRDIMRKLGIYHELTRQGATGESLIKIGDSPEFTLVEQ